MVISNTRCIWYIINVHRILSETDYWKWSKLSGNKWALTYKMILLDFLHYKPGKTYKVISMKKNIHIPSNKASSTCKQNFYPIGYSKVKNLVWLELEFGMEKLQEFSISLLLKNNKNQWIFRNNEKLNASYFNMNLIV